MTWRHAIAAGIAVLVAMDAGLARAPEATRADVQEFVVGVSSIDRVLPAFRDVFRWDVKHRGPASPAIAALWNLPSGTEIREVLLGNRASRYGFVRLVETTGLPRELVRVGGRWWDTGGVFNINVLVKDLDATVTGLRALGFSAGSLPESYEYPDGRRGRMTIMRGPDDLVLSFQQRTSAPVTTFPAFEGATHVEIGYQIVKDVDAWYRFHVEVLGLTSEGPPRERRSPQQIGPNDYGLPHNIVGATDSRQIVIKPHGESEQGLGGRQFLTSTGHDVEALVLPQNLGITTLRLRVDDLEAIVSRLAAHGVTMLTAPQRIDLPPYGSVRLLAVRTPGGSGVRLEIFQR